MLKTIRIHKQTYDRLEALRDKRETFDDVIKRAVDLVEELRRVKGA